MSRKRTEGFFNEKLFVLFPVEEENETWHKWGEERYTPLGIAEIEAVVTDNSNSIFRPGCYEIKNSKIIHSEVEKKDFPIRKIVFYSRDYVVQALPEEKIRACGLLEEVTNIKTQQRYYRLVIGYFDSYLSDRREKEYIKKIS